MFSNFYRFADFLEKRSNESEGFIESLNKEIAEDWMKNAVPITPVKTGMMKASWEVRGSGKSIVLTNKMYYSGFVDLGTKKITPRRISERALHIVDNITLPRIERKINDWLQFR